MKKLLLTIALAFATLASQAQTEWYGQVGLSLNKFSYSSEYEYGCDFKRNVGYEVMFGFLRPMGEKGLFLWGMNFGMGTRGSKSEWKDVLYEGCEIHFLENDESRFMFQYCPFELNSRIQIGSSIRMWGFTCRSTCPGRLNIKLMAWMLSPRSLTILTNTLRNGSTLASTQAAGFGLPARRSLM